MDDSERLYRWIGSKIATAEGYGRPGAIPTDARNPGDLELGNRFGLTVIHLGHPYTGAIHGVTIYPKAHADCDPEDPQDGFAALYREIRSILSRKSTIYGPEWTIAQIAAKWTRTDPEDWAKNVAEGLGVTTDTRLCDIEPPKAISA